MSDSKKKIYLGEDLVCQTFTDAEEQAKAFDLFGLEQPVVSSNAPASTRPVQQGQVCEFDGVNDYISAAHLTGSETVTSSVGTSTPSISAGRVDFTAGTCGNLILSDGTQYNLNHASGTTAYDSSGNGNDGTLQNGAAFVVDNTLPPEADKLNLEGYTDDSGVLKPRDESDPTKDIDGNPLQYSGSVYPRRPEYRNSYAAIFDGVDDYVELPAQVLSLNQAWSIEVDFKYLATPTYRTIYGEGNSATGTPQINLGILGTHSRLGLYWRSNNNTVIIDEALFAVSSGNRHTVKVAFDGVDEVTVWKDGVNTDTFTVTPLATTVDRTTIGALGRNNEVSFANAQISHVKTTQSGSTVGEYTLAEGAGDTVYDISGNGNHGTINNASTGTEGAGFWAGRIDGEANALNNNNGFSLYENGGNKLRVPYISGAAISSPTVPAGYTLTSENPAITDGYNGAETELDAYNIAEGDNPSPATNNNSALESIEFGADFASNDAAYMRLKSSTENDRLITFEDDLTGGDETLAQKYTQ